MRTPLLELHLAQIEALSVVRPGFHSLRRFGPMARSVSIALSGAGADSPARTQRTGGCATKPASGPGGDDIEGAAARGYSGSGTVSRGMFERALLRISLAVQSTPLTLYA